MKKTVKEISRLLNGEVVGDEKTVITGICGIKEAQEGDLTFLANSRYISLAATTKASCILVSKDTNIPSKTLIKTDNPSLAFANILSVWAPDSVKKPTGIHPTAVIGKNAKLGKDVAMQPYAVVEDGAVIGDNTILYSHVFVGANTKIGDNCVIYPNVVIREGLQIGNNVIIHSGAVIGSDGFGYASIKGIHHKIPQIGNVIIEDNVEIGANVAIDRARFGKTVIGKGTKIDNLVHIAHNVEIGENCIIIAQAGISGSTKVGNAVTIAGQAGIVGHVTIGENAIIGGGAGVTKSVPPNTFVSGYPAKPHHTAKRINACIQRLPILFKLVSTLEKKIGQMENKNGSSADNRKRD